MSTFLSISDYQRIEDSAADLAPTDPRLAKQLTSGRIKGSATPQKISARPILAPDKIPRETVTRWPKTLCRVHGAAMYRYENNMLEWYSGARVTVAGSPRAYHPLNKDALEDINEERLRGYAALLRDADGGLVLQSRTDPAPGYCITPTLYRKPGFEAQDPRAFLDPEREPYVALPLRVFLAAGKLPPLLGCRAVVCDLDRNFMVQGPVADVDREGTGALSAWLWKEMSLRHDPQMGGRQQGFRFWVFPGEACPGYELQPWAP